MNHIEAAVLPLKTDAVERAEKEARHYIARVADILAQHDWDLNAAAPYPSYHQTKTMTRLEIEVAKGRHNSFSMLTTYADGHRYHGMPNRPNYRKMDEAACERFVQNSKAEAAAQYDLFVAKLVKKIGACDSATLEGNHVWGHSILTVTKGETVERWKTQQIVNTSVLGKLFNQWPTRKVK